MPGPLPRAVLAHRSAGDDRKRNGSRLAQRSALLAGMTRSEEIRSAMTG